MSAGNPNYSSQIQGSAQTGGNPNFEGQGCPQNPAPPTAPPSQGQNLAHQTSSAQNYGPTGPSRPIVTSQAFTLDTSLAAAVR